MTRKELLRFRHLRDSSKPSPEAVPDSQRRVDRIHSFSKSLTSGIARKGIYGTVERDQSRAHYRSKDEEFSSLLANVRDIQRKLSQRPSNAILTALLAKQVAKLQFLGEIIASKDNYSRRTICPDRQETRSDRLTPISRTERL